MGSQELEDFENLLVSLMVPDISPLKWPLFLCRNFPSSLFTLSKMDCYIKDGNARITANMRLLNSVLFFLLSELPKFNIGI